MKKWISAAGFIGLILFLYGLISAIFYSNIITWYSFFTIGGAFFLGYVNYKLGNKSFLRKFEKNKVEIFKIYLLYFFFGVLIELVGKFILNLWEFPPWNNLNYIIHGLIIGYPFAFFFIYEALILIKSKIKSTELTILLSTIIFAFLHEIPNTFVWTWVYTIPYLTFEILQINILVIIFWSVLIVIPLVVAKILNPKTKIT